MPVRHSMKAARRGRAILFAAAAGEVVVDADGSGCTRYKRHFGVGEIECWVVSAFCGPEAELDRFGSAPVTADFDVIEEMARRLGSPGPLLGGPGRREARRTSAAAECTTGHARGGAGPCTGACRSRAAALLLDLARLRRFSGSPFLVAIGGRIQRIGATPSNLTR